MSMLLTILNIKKKQFGEQYIGLIRAQLPGTRTKVQTIGLLIAPDLVLATASSIFSSPKQTYFTDITFQMKQHRERVVDYRVSIDHIDVQGKTGGFSLLKLQRRINFEGKLELNAFNNQIDKIEVLTLGTKKTEISGFFRHQVINLKAEEQKGLFYELKMTTQTDSQRIITGAPLVFKATNKQKLIVVGVHLGTIKLNSNGNQLYGKVFEQKHFQIFKQWQRQMIKQSTIIVNPPLLMQSFRQIKNIKTQTAVQSIDKSTQTVQQNHEIIVNQTNDQKYRDQYLDLIKQLQENEYLSLSRESNHNLMSKDMQFQNLKKKYQSLKRIIGNLYRVKTIQDIQTIKLLYQNHLLAEKQ